MTQLMRAEVRKLRYTRSLWALPVIGAALSMLTSGIAIASFKPAELAGTLSEHGALRFGPTNVGLLLLVFGLRVFADETQHHTLAATYITSPGRRSVLAAKLVVASGVALLFCAVVFGAVIGITAAGVSSRDLAMTVDWSQTAALLARTAVAMTLLTALGLLVGVIVRNRSVALVGALVWLAMLENIVGGILKAPELLPGALVRALVDGGGNGDALAAPSAAALLIVLTAVIGAGATLRLRADVA